MSATSYGVVYRLHVKPRGKPIRSLPAQVSLQGSDSTDCLYEEVSKISGHPAHRLRISLGKDGSQAVAKSTGKTLASDGLASGMELFVKDLAGPQVDWQTVFVVEYLGPLIIHPVLYKLRLANPTPSQTLTFCMVMVQFAKRELETPFVHRFSLATMPVRNIVKNSAHYWALAGLWMGWFVYTPLPHNDAPPLTLQAYLGLVLFALGASLNTCIHLVQRSLRPAGTTERRVPSGLGFTWVTCPNYMFETVTWVGVLLVSRSWAVALFLAVSLAQMKLWADKKERRYRNECPSTYTPKRFGLIPGLL